LIRPRSRSLPATTATVCPFRKSKTLAVGHLKRFFSDNAQEILSDFAFGISNGFVLPPLQVKLPGQIFTPQGRTDSRASRAIVFIFSSSPRALKLIEDAGDRGVEEDHFSLGGSLMCRMIAPEARRTPRGEKKRICWCLQACLQIRMAG
jgi:hypothetical protein